MLKFFRIIGWLEGLSFLLLLFVGMPLKYFANNPTAVKALGMPHGVLFIFYVVLAVSISIELNWPRKVLFLAFAAAFLPLGTFIFDRRYLRRAKPV